MPGRELTVEQRLDIIERDSRDHAKTISAHNDTLRDHALRLSAIEEERRARRLEEVRREEREEARHEALKVEIASVKRDVSEVKTDTNSIKASAGKLGWLVVGAVVVIVVGFALRGGGFAP